MIISSLARKTDFIFMRHHGIIQEKDDYIVVKTPANPNHYWGNYLVMKKAPQVGDYPRWTTLFKKEFSDLKDISHMTFTWEEKKPGDYLEFCHQGFRFDEGVTLSTSSVQKPPKYNSELLVKKIISPSEWEKVTQLQILNAEPGHDQILYENYKRKQMHLYQKMSAQRKGHWYGGYFAGKLVADLGIFFEANYGRFQQVETHPKYRRQGFCQTLVYQSAQIAFSEYGVDTLVMEADENYHAAKIYESVGFIPTEKTYGLCYWQ